MEEKEMNIRKTVKSLLAGRGGGRGAGGGGDGVTGDVGHNGGDSDTGKAGGGGNGGKNTDSDGTNGTDGTQKGPVVIKADPLKVTAIDVQAEYVLLTVQVPAEVVYGSGKTWYDVSAFTMYPRSSLGRRLSVALR